MDSIYKTRIKLKMVDIIDLSQFAEKIIIKLIHPNERIFNGLDFAHEAFCIEQNDKKNAKQIVFRLIYSEKLRNMANWQRNSTKNRCGEKQCSKCKQHKTHSEYRELYDARYGLKYFYYMCKECENEYVKSEDFKAKRKIYLSDPKRKKEANEKAKEWYKKNRKYKNEYMLLRYAAKKSQSQELAKQKK